MSFYDWKDKYRPILNNLRPDLGQNAFQGTLFEITRPETSIVDQFPPEKVWTLIESDDVLLITNGFHYVNRAGYFITEVPFTGPEDFIEVIIFDARDMSEEDSHEVEVTAC